MSIKHWNLLKFFGWVVLWGIAGAVFSNWLRDSFVATYWSGSGFHWLNTAIILIAVGVAGGYWMYAQQTEIRGTKTRLKTALAFHAGAFALILLGVGLYALAEKPIDNKWLSLMIGWGIIVVGHGILAWRVKRTPEDIFV